MIAPIGPGDWVECVDVRRGLVWGAPSVQIGTAYFVEGVDAANYSCSLCGQCGGLALRGVRTKCPGNTFKACRFRLIYKRKEGAFDHLLQPIKADAEPVKVSQSASGEGLLWLPEGVETFPTVDAAWAAMTALSELPQALKLKESNNGHSSSR